jgi:hypothetical protein
MSHHPTNNIILLLIFRRYLCERPKLAVVHDTTDSTLLLRGRDALVEVDAPWHLAPEVQGSFLPAGSRGRVMTLPALAGVQEGGGDAAAPQQVVVVWDVDAEMGMGPVLLLARAAHCLQALHATDAARKQIEHSELWRVR